MLAQNFKTPTELHLTQVQFSALVKTLVLLETDKLKHVDPDDYHLVLGDNTFTGHFNMNTWHSHAKECGTIACIGGTAEMLGGINILHQTDNNSNLYDLFFPMGTFVPPYADITTQHAARALRNYLNRGKPHWKEVFA